VGEGHEAYDAVTARAVGRLATLAELASPLLRDGGVLVAWKGGRSAEEEAEGARAAERVAMEPTEIRSMQPYPASRDRHIHLLRKNGPTPNGLPRRPGVAAKRPFGSEPT
jgi:16S rRNA (guanine527-N7)-methyltransferase